MINIKEFFNEIEHEFTIYVVEQRFAIGRGSEYFRSYQGKINYIDTNLVIKKRISKILYKINKHIPNTAELVKKCFGITSFLSIIDIIALLSKLFGTNEHQAAGPDVIDPIIIQEGDILPKYINQLIALHQFSILRPTIIILLKDNDLIRAKLLFSGCPHNTNVKMIRNSGESEIFKVVNCGAESIDEFLDAFSCQCFSTCSNTKRSILLNQDWSENLLIKQFGPMIMQIRANLLFRDKTLEKNQLNILIDEIKMKAIEITGDTELLLLFECILKLFRVFCNDGGVQDMEDALRIANDLNNDILLAHVYRNSYFLSRFSIFDRLDMMRQAYDIFTKNGMEDHAIYCKNNSLVRQFEMDTVSVSDFLELQEEAVHNVPGLVGMSHILNNVGAAFLTTGRPEQSIEYFDKGLNYAYRPERSIQRIALLSNRAIAKTYCYNIIEETELRKIMNSIFDNKEVLNLPFLSARYALNIVAIAYNQSISLGREFLKSYPVGNLIQKSLSNNLLGSGQLLLQMDILQQKYGQIDAFELLHRPHHYLDALGIRKEFIQKHSFNPCSFSIWF